MRGSASAPWLALLLVACTPGAKERLERQGVAWSEASFVESAGEGKTEAVRLFLDGGMSPEARDASGNTALMSAAAGGHAETVRVLLESGAGPSTAGNATKATPLGLAASAGHVAIVDLLIVKGAQVDPRETQMDMTALAVAAFKGHAAVVKRLAAAKAELNPVDRSGSTPLMHAADQGHRDVVDALVAGGADINFRADGVTALMIAAQAGRREIATALIAAGADVNARTDKGYTVLAAAREAGDVEMERLLRDSGAFEAAGRVCSTPATWAVADPFTDQTLHWPSYSTMPGRSRDGPGTHRLLLRSPNEGQSQIFVIRGEAAVWLPRVKNALEDLEQHPLVTRERHSAETADGVGVEYTLARMRPGIIGGDDVTYLLAAVPFADQAVVIDAGGLTGAFDAGLVVKCIRSMRIQGGAYTGVSHLRRP